MRVTERVYPVTLAAAITAAIFCCAPQKAVQPYLLNPDYEKANLSNRVVVLEMPTENRILIENPKDVVDDYGGLNASSESRIKKFYFPLFIETFTSYLSGDSVLIAPTGYRFDSIPRREVNVVLSQDSTPLTFTIPSKDDMRNVGLDSAIVVHIQTMRFKRNNFYVEYYWDDKTKRPANLEVQATLVIWDYKNDKPVFYGTLTQKIEFQIAMQRKHWDESARLLAKKIVLTAKCL